MLRGGWSASRIAAADRPRREAPSCAGWRITLTTPVGTARLFVEAPCSEAGARRYGHAFVNHALATHVTIEASEQPPWRGVDEAELDLAGIAARRLRTLCPEPSKCLHNVPPPPEPVDVHAGEVRAFAEYMGVKIVDE